VPRRAVRGCAECARSRSRPRQQKQHWPNDYGTTLQQIVEFTQDRPAAARWILVPTLAAGHTLGERLARGGSPGRTCDSLLRSIWRRGLPARFWALVASRRWTPGSVPRSFCSCCSICRPMSRSISGRSSTSRAWPKPLWAAVSDFRLAGLNFSDLQPEAFKSRQKHAEWQRF